MSFVGDAMKQRVKVYVLKVDVNTEIYQPARTYKNKYIYCY